MLCLCQLDQKMKQQIKEHSSTPPPLLTLKKPDARKNIHCKLSVCAHRPILIFLGIKCLTHKIFFGCQGGVIIFKFPSQGNAKYWILSMATNFLPYALYLSTPFYQIITNRPDNSTTHSYCAIITLEQAANQSDLVQMV